LREWYGFAIGAAFSGVVGVGFYPLWEIVFGVVLAAMAAILGLQQRLLSKFRITTNGGQCISCGNCSIMKWELTFVVMLKRRKHCSFFLCRLWYLCGCLS
jgi:hypothetical protein